ncbi:leucine-rich repeat-containing protein 43-like [Scyliorhinus canicula]|uniref:leucine-rich repeat-containing protein 43-like n=1 Tax=Scyliorhinus canicula TaxID=7830 RepID=UPI0018F30A11|nr:leucine-rich repeat-containing protein 43-like [Scyliorhinus canicula]
MLESSWSLCEEQSLHVLRLLEWMEMTTVTAFKAFQQQVNAMCLNDFPSGVGSWNRSKHSTKKAEKFKQLKYHGEHEKLKCKDVNEEEPKALKEYLTCEQSPWQTKDISPEIQHLREMAIASTSLIKENFLCSYLKSLRIVGRQVREVDKDILRFQNLEELVLSVNRIPTVNSANLPRKLTVLELCSNEISSLKELCVSPPPRLQYLGLSHNKLSLDSEYNYFSKELWPNLISLDLSFNDFSNLRDIVIYLILLPNLKNLILLGNPLALLPNYRGFILDDLQNLVSLDDVLISPDERHHFKGISKHRDFIVPDARVTINIGKVRGIPNPIDPLEELPEFPVVKNSYFVTYEFLGSLENPCEWNELQTEGTPEDTQIENSLNGLPNEKDTFSSQAIPTALPDLRINATHIENEESFCVFNYKLPQKSWGDPITYHYSKVHLVKELYGLKQLLQNGLTVTVTQEKILSWPIEIEEEKSPETSVKGKAQDSAKGGKDNGVGKKDKGKDNGKGKKDKGKDNGVGTKDKDKDNGVGTKDKDADKKNQPILLQSDPPVQKILGTYHIDLYSIVTGNHFFEKICDLGVPKIEPKVKSPTPDIKETKKGKGAKKKDPKSGKDSRASEKSKPKDTPDNKKGKGKRDIDSGVSEEVKPKHLFVEFKLRLGQWLTTVDAENEIYKNDNPYSWISRS